MSTPRHPRQRQYTNPSVQKCLSLLCSMLCTVWLNQSVLASPLAELDHQKCVVPEGVESDPPTFGSTTNCQWFSQSAKSQNLSSPWVGSWLRDLRNPNNYVRVMFMILKTPNFAAIFGPRLLRIYTESNVRRHEFYDFTNPTMACCLSFGIQ